MHSLVPLEQTSKSPSLGFIIALSTTLSTSTILSILLLAFKANSAISYDESMHNGLGGNVVTLRPDRINGGLFLAIYPDQLFNRLVEPTLASASISLALALVLGSLSLFVFRRRKALLLSTLQRLIFFFLLAGNCVLSLVICMIGFIHTAQSARFDPGYRSRFTNYEYYGQGYKYDGGTFDLASWSCQISAYTPFDDSDHLLSRHCVDETAALWVGLLLTLSNLGVAGLVWIDWKGDRMLIRDNSGLGDEYADYIGERELFP